MNAVITRIVLRYLSGALVASGFLNPAIGGLLTSDPDVAMVAQVVVGAAVAAATEWSYVLAKRWGWAT